MHFNSTKFKGLLALLTALLITPILNAQIITFEPSFATENDELTIIYDATEGNKGLEDFDGDVYLHTGVITDKSTQPSDWKYVIFDWETNDPQAKATKLGDNKWQFKYSPTIREFFNVTDANEQVLQVAIVFKGVKNGQIVAEGKEAGNQDIFIDLVEGSLNAKFEKPAKDGLILNKGDTQEILALGNYTGGTPNLTLYLNEQVIQTEEAESISYNFEADVAGDYLFKLIAEAGALKDTAYTHLTVKDGNGDFVSRPANLRDGITLGNNSAEFSLFAPGKNFVYLVGDFNDWTPSADYLMKKDSLASDKVWFWTQVNGLTAGEEYAFQYLVDNEIRIADPYSELVLHPDDRYISEETYPNLKPYPAEGESFAVGVIQPGAPEFVWEATDYVRPNKEHLIIYELLIRDFVENHDYATLIDTLDYLENLGINAIELLPINEYEGNESWGYNPAFHIAADKYYGPQEDLKRFVDEAHKRGIAVILDVVLNHAFGQSPLVRLWNEGNYGKPTPDNPYLNVNATHPFNVGYDFNHESEATRYYRNRVAEYWLTEFNMDGFRFDLSKGFTQKNNPDNVGAWGEYDQSRIDIWKDYSDYIWSVDSDAYIILEHFADNSEEKVLANYGMMLWGNANQQYNEATMGYGSNLNSVLSETRGYNNRHLVGYMESHDEQWLMMKNIKYGNSKGNYDIKNLETALQRQELAGAFFLTLPGPKMIWQFGELGYGYGDNGEQCLNDSNDCPASAPTRTGNKPIRWDYWTSPSNTARQNLYKTWSALLNLRHSTPAFTEPSNFYQELHSNPNKRILLEHEDAHIVIVGNFGVETITAFAGFSKTGTWYDYMANTEYVVNSVDENITLQPGEFKVFTSRKFDLPGILVSNEMENLADHPTQFKLEQNYPNPFNPTTNLKFDVAKAGMVKLEVFDVLGRKVAELVNENKAAGTYNVTFDASHLGSGIYLARYTAGGNVYTQKMALIK